MRAQLLRVCCAVTVVAAAVAGFSSTRTASAAFPGDNGRLIFEDSDGESILITTMDEDGGAPTTIGPFTDAAYPAYSADGQRIALVRIGADRPGLYVMDADGANAALLVAAPRDNRFLSPTWSADGSTIAFVRQFRSSATTAYIAYDDIIAVDVASREAALLIGGGNGTYYNHPAYSPDGTRIAYVSSHETTTGGQEIWTARANGASRIQRTATQNTKGRADWSPNSNRLVFQHGAGNGAEIAIISSGAVEEDDPREVTANDVFDGVPVWSPDGTRIAFVRFAFPVIRSASAPSAPAQSASDDPQVFTMNPNGTGVSGPLYTSQRLIDTDWQAVEPPPPPPPPSITIPPPPPPPEVTIPPPPPPPEEEPDPDPPVLMIDRPVSPGGQVPMVSGINFGPGDTVTLRWEPGIGATDVVVGGDGAFEAPLLVMGKDVLGDREVLAVVDGEVVARAPILIVPGTYEPGGLDSSFFARG